MWPFVSYPECSPEDVEGKSYDYIVVGGGTAGCALAARLSEDPRVSVLLIERGHVKNNIVSRMPLLSLNLFWTKTLQVQNTIRSEPIHGAYGRTNQLWAVNGVGGGSRLNAMLWTRGSPANYDGWSDLGLTDWSWGKVEPYFKKVENLTGPLDQSQIEARGRGGPMELCRPRYHFKWLEYLEKAAMNTGLATTKDCNLPDAPSCGYCPLDTAINSNGERVSAMSAYLNRSVARERIDRLSVCTGTVASRLEIAGDEKSGRVISGVHIRSAAHSPGKDYFVKARREVILSCGAMTTPQLLLLSGIGPRQNESTGSHLGIPLIKELTAVGADFSDHYSVPIILEIPSNETIHILEVGLWGLWYLLVWIFTGKGIVGTSVTPSAVFLHTDAINEETMQIERSDKEDDHKVIPNIEIMTIPTNSLDIAVPGRSLFSLYPTITQPRAKGRVEIISKDPLVNPKITHPMFGHIEDLKTARLAVRFTMRLADEFQAIYPFSAPFAFAPGNGIKALDELEKLAQAEMTPITRTVVDSPLSKKTWRDVTDDEIDDYMRRVGHSSIHYTSTCPMGTSEKNGVVDQRLVVFGFKNLRIADASVLPKVTSAHTMAPILMIAERCADFVKGDWDSKRK